MKDDLGDRMKAQYEDRTRYMLPRRTYTIIRCDGKAFHTYTRHCKKPFDNVIESAMDQAALRLFDEAQGAKLAFVQSDEISVLLTDFEKPETAAWFDGNVQKMCSVSASVCTMAFNSYVEGLMAMNESPTRLNGTALFDARVFTIPDPVEVENYFIWRQKDAERNSLSSLAQSHFSHKQLQGKSCANMHEMLHEAGVNWDKLPTSRKRGRTICTKNLVDLDIPVFTKERKFLTDKIPRQWAEGNTIDQVEDIRYWLEKRIMGRKYWEQGDGTCIVSGCKNPVKWLRKTQFAGDHAFCEDCARKDPGFDKYSLDYIWQRLS